MAQVGFWKLHHTFDKLARDDRGNIAVIFTVALIPILLAVGAAVDYARASSARSAMQQALDSTVLMISKEAPNLTAAQISAKAQAYFNSLYSQPYVSSIAVITAYTAPTGTTAAKVDISGTGSVPTSFMKIAGVPSMAIKSNATATWGNTKSRIAIALDVTGSMAADGKIDAMKTAAKNLIDTLKASANATGDVYVSIIPFAQMVNVGLSNKNANWIKWDDFGFCSYPSNVLYNAYFSRFASNSSCQSNGGTWSSLSNKNYWTGCVSDRDQSYDTTKDAPSSNATDFTAAYSVQGGLDVCPAQILPMTSLYSASDVSIVKAKIDSLLPNGGTNQAIGMHWAWMSLQQTLPLNAPAKDSNYNYADVIILMSDGLNTIDRWYGNGSSPSPQVDARQTLLCSNIKSATGSTKTTVYTIQVNTDGDPESAVLRNCADSGNFYATTTAAGIATAFNAIGASISKLRLAK